ncbi:MAG: RDD family protein [Candidatus Velthaea sp.]
MERTLEVRTGESISIQYELAGVGSRFLAVGVDLAIQLGVTVALALGMLLAAKPLARAAAEVSPNLTKGSEAIFLAAGVVAVFLLYFGYFIIFELWWSGRTPGKRALGIRVVRDAGFPIDLGAAVVRNIVRVLEFALGLYALSAVSAILSRQNKRLGDFAAGTIVVRERGEAPANLRAYLARDAPADDGLSPGERELVERYVARRAGLEPRARSELAAQIAQRVRPHLRATFAHLDDDALLRHLGRSADD